MWKTKSKGSSDLTMTEGDYGISIPFFVDGVTIAYADSVKYTFKTEKNGETLFTKEFTGINDNIVDFSLTQAESNLLEVGNYIYTMDWYRNGNFMYCLVENGKLKVVDKP